MTIPSKLVATILGVLLTAAIGFNAWGVTAMFDRPTRSDVSEMINDKAPQSIERALHELKLSVDENTKQIIRLQAVVENR